MSTITASIKTEAGYKKILGTVEGKFGQQLVLYAEGKSALVDWLKNPEPKNLYLNLKTWDNPKADYKPEELPELSDEIPF